MFTTKQFVPRITDEQLEEMEKVVPGLRALHNIRAVIHVEDAEELARNKVNAYLVKYERIATTLGIDTTPNGWTFTFKCIGD